MARITNLKRDDKKCKEHAPTECKYYVFEDKAGDKILQLDTLGSAERVFEGKVSQSIQFSPGAIQQLKRIFEQEGL